MRPMKGKFKIKKMDLEKIYYNKLIRDKIPDKIKNKGSALEIRELSDEEFEKELIKKVEEEASGLQKAESREDFISEIADVMDILEAIKRLKNISDEEIKKAQQESLEKKGGFDKKTFLVWSQKDDYQSNEIKR